ncbi:MAG: ArnT family glycosyltransferase [Ignavibacteria bacterium]
MSGKESNKNFKPSQIIILILGLITIGLGIFASGPRLIEMAHNLSADKSLSPPTTEFLYGLQVKIILLGAFLILLSFLWDYILKLIESLIGKIQSSNLIEKIAALFGKLSGSVYRFISNEKFLWTFIVLVLFGFLFTGIFTSPYGGFHVEGINLQPAKNFVEHGIYGTLSKEGFDKYTYRISAGPGIVLPNALIFKIFGINIYYSRALYALFVIASAFMFYYMARDIYGKKVALLALLILIPLLPLYRQQAVDAYLPALFYLLMGALFWFKSIESGRNVYLYLSGIFWGISFQTMWLFLFAVFAAVITWIVLRLSNNGIKSRYYIIPTVVVILVTLAWFFFRIYNVGPRQELVHLQQFWGQHANRAIGTGTVEGLVPVFYTFARPIASLIQIDIWGHFQFFIVIPAIFYAVLLISRSKWTDYKSMFFLSFILIWFLWWFVFNLDLARTHFQMVVLLSQIFVAKLLYDLWNQASQNKLSFLGLLKNTETQSSSIINYTLRVIVSCMIIGKVFLPLFEGLGTMYSSNETLTKPYKEMIGFIKTNTEKNAMFSGWKWSLPWYVDLENNIDRIVKDRAAYPAEQREKVPEYFIISPEWPLEQTVKEWPNVSVDSKQGKKQNKARKNFIEQNCTHIKTFGGDKHKWILYKVNNNNITQLFQ